MSVRCFLEVSSGHLSAETWSWLDEQTADDLVRDPRHRHGDILGGRTRHGWFVYAHEDPTAPVPADLLAVMRLTRQRECDYALLDCDVLPMEDLPVLHPGFKDTPAPA